MDTLTICCPFCDSENLAVRQTNGYLSLIKGRATSGLYAWRGWTIDKDGHTPPACDHLRNLTRAGQARLVCLECDHAWWDNDAR